MIDYGFHGPTGRTGRVPVGPFFEDDGIADNRLYCVRAFIRMLDWRDMVYIDG